MEQQQKVSLKTLAEGAAIERFDDELEKVLLNITDPNTADGTREITLTVKLTPNEERTFCRTLIECKSKVRAARQFETNLYVGFDQGSGEVMATEYNPKQEKMVFQTQARAATSPLKAV